MILDARLRLRIMAKRSRLTENAKRRRVEIAEENFQYLEKNLAKNNIYR
jgi:hypothetical protein